MQGMYIKRHNAAVTMVTAAIAKGARGGCYMVMDACAEEDTPSFSAGTRLPAWLLPTVPKEIRKKMRPDLLVIPGIPLAVGTRARYPGPSADQRRNLTVHIVELGYTGDLRHAEKQHDKAVQHRQLMQALQDHGWTVRYTPREAISLGVGGTVRKDLKQLLMDMGTTAAEASQCSSTLHHHAVTALNDMVKCRRFMERSQQGTAPGVG